MAPNLVPADTNASEDIFVRDRLTGTTSRVSIGGGGAQADADSYYPCISADGRYVSFLSYATNLVAGDTNAAPDVFTHDRATGMTTRDSVAWDGSQGNGNCSVPSMSADGRFVSFQSASANLVVGDTNGKLDVFVRDRLTAATNIVSVASGGIVQGNSDSYNSALSADGRYVVFDSQATNLVAGDTNAASDVFVRDRLTGTTTRVSITSGGVQANNATVFPKISADGRYVVFASYASNLVPGDANGSEDVFVRDTLFGTTTLVSVTSAGVQGTGPSADAVICPDGHSVAFGSDAPNLVSGDTNAMSDTFVHNMLTGVTSRISVPPSGGQQNASSMAPDISADGRYVSFSSYSTNLVPGDTNGQLDAFVVQLGPSISSVARQPGKSSVTYKRKKGVAKYTLSASVTGDFGRPIAAASVYLQSSKNGKAWKTYARLTTNGAGVGTRSFRSKSRSTTYYRWYLPATETWVSATTSKQKVTVK
jgi:archaellum component FlaF (FlaF/FlaG flagellin family)